jgi:hypothetical protein
VLPVRYELYLYMLCRRKLTASVVWWSVSGYITEIYCASCEVQTEFIYVTSCTRPRVAVAPSGATEENEERGSPRFKYV